MMLQDFDQADKFDSRNPQNEDWQEDAELTTLQLLQINLSGYYREFVDTDVIEFSRLPFDDAVICFECIGSQSAGNIVGMNEGERIIELGKFDHSIVEKIGDKEIEAFFTILELYL